MAGWVLAVDFGTSFTAAAVGSGGRSESLEVDSSRYVPSAVCRDEDGGLLVGRAALSRAAVFPERAELVPKRALVAGEVVRLAGQDVATVELVAAVLRRVVDEACRQRGHSMPDAVVLTHPARWGDHELSRLLQAAEAAGISAPHFLAEPIAAAFHYLAEHPLPVGACAAVYDLGGGTLDTAVVRRTEHGFELAGPPGGDPEFGGHDLDALLRAVVQRHAEALDAATWRQLWEAGDTAAARRRGRWRAAITEAREVLSSRPVTAVYEEGYEAGLRLTRAEFEAAAGPRIRSSVQELASTVHRAGRHPGDLAAVYLTGGASRTPVVSDLIAAVLGILPTTTGDPKTAVTLGALAALTHSGGSFPAPPWTPRPQLHPTPTPAPADPTPVPTPPPPPPSVGTAAWPQYTIPAPGRLPSAPGTDRAPVNRMSNNRLSKPPRQLRAPAWTENHRRPEPPPKLQPSMTGMAPQPGSVSQPPQRNTAPSGPTPPFASVPPTTQAPTPPPVPQPARPTPPTNQPGSMLTRRRVLISGAVTATLAAIGTAIAVSSSGSPTNNGSGSGPVRGSYGPVQGNSANVATPTVRPSVVGTVSGAARELQISPNGRYLVFLGDSGAELWDATQLRRVASLANVEACAWCPDNRLLITDVIDHGPFFVDPDTQQRSPVFPSGSSFDAVGDIVVKRDGSAVISYGFAEDTYTEGLAAVAFGTGKEGSVLQLVSQLPPTKVALGSGPAGVITVEYGASGGSAVCSMWNIDTGQKLSSMSMGLGGLVVSPDGTLAATSTTNGGLAVYTTANFSRVAEIPQSLSIGSPVAFTPDNNALAVSAMGMSVVDWRSGKVRAQLATPSGSSVVALSNSATFTPDGTRLIVATANDGAGAPIYSFDVPE